jgi:ubiquinol-cytochrome c reductase cytochrome b subunit
MLGLTGLHLLLVRRHGITPVPADADRPKKKFYPGQVFKDTVAVFGYVVVIAVLAAFANVGLGRMADPTDTAYIPRPEWYFLFLFEMLKWFQGPLEVFGAVILPNLALVALILTPFLDRGTAATLRRRTTAIAVVVLSAIGWAGLTQRAVATTPPSLEAADAGLRPPQSWAEIPAEHLAAIGYFRQDNCGSCHNLGRSGAGPDLAKAASIRPADWLMEHFRKPSPESPDSRLSMAQIRSLVALVTRRDDRGVDAWVKAPDEPVQGAMLYQARQCGFCHVLNGTGGNLAPLLNGLADRHNRDWVVGHFIDPKKFVPESRMPAFNFNDHDMNLMTNYLMSIPR